MLAWSSTLSPNPPRAGTTTVFGALPLTLAAMGNGVLIVLLIFGSLFCDWALLAPVFTLLFRWSGQDQKRLRFSFALSAALFGWLNYTSSVWLYPTAQCLLMACGSMAGIAASGFVILYLYNGQRAARGKKFSHWFFYLFYPVHLLVLGVIRVMG